MVYKNEDQVVGRRWTHNCPFTNHEIAWDIRYVSHCISCGMDAMQSSNIVLVDKKQDFERVIKPQKDAEK